MKCLNIDAEFIVINRFFFKEQISDAYICIMITFLIVRDLRIIKYKINKYILIFIYIYEKDNIIDERIRTCFIKKVYIINDLKFNIFIDNDINESEDIIIFIENRIAYIKSCDVTVFLKIKIIEIVMTKSIYLRKIIVISFKTRISIKIDYLIVLYKIYLFESKKIFNLIAYAHLINAFIKTILLCNEFDIFVQIFRNYRLKKFIEVNYFNIFLIFFDHEKNEIYDLIVKRFRSSK